MQTILGFVLGFAPVIIGRILWVKSGPHRPDIL
jgi:hypothetical protein